jgi:hypothetical protein
MGPKLSQTSKTCGLPALPIIKLCGFSRQYIRVFTMAPLLFALSLTFFACATLPPTTPEQLNGHPSQTEITRPAASDTPRTISDTSTATPENHKPTEVVTTASPTPDADAWQKAPIVPEISNRARQIFEEGLALGNDPQNFSKIGDSETFTSWFLAPFDKTPPTYRLGEYVYLQGVIHHFSGSYARQSIAARQGFNASSVFAPLWADPVLCEAGETPLACEFRLHQPAYVFILLGTNDIWHLDTFEEQIRRIIEYSINEGVIPILGTKADNLEGDGSVNRTLYTLALEYEIPLWNFWAAVQDLPQAGLDVDQAHLTFGYNYFDDPKAMLNAWPVRNLTALQVLDAVLRATQP